LIKDFYLRLSKEDLVELLISKDIELHDLRNQLVILNQEKEARDSEANA